MTCGSKTFVAAQMLRSPSPGESDSYTAMSEGARVPLDCGIDSWPNYLAGPPFNLDCATAKMYMNWPADLLQVWAGVVQNGTIIPLPDASNCTPHTTGSGVVGCSYGVNIDGEYKGSIDYRSDTGFSYDGVSPFPFTVGLGGGKITIQKISNLGLGVTYFDFSCIVQKMATVDFETWWCCASNCCAAPPGNPGPRFLIPRPADPETGEENISSPPLFTPLNLSNYTFQFINDFGRVK